MKSTIVIAAALALCGTAFAGTASQLANTPHEMAANARQEAHQIGSSFRHDFHRIARGDTFRQSQMAGQRRMRSHTTAMGAGPAYSMSSSRQARMDAAYADWQRSHR